MAFAFVCFYVHWDDVIWKTTFFLYLWLVAAFGLLLIKYCSFLLFRLSNTATAALMTPLAKAVFCRLRESNTSVSAFIFLTLYGFNLISYYLISVYCIMLHYAISYYILFYFIFPFFHILIKGKESERNISSGHSLWSSRCICSNSRRNGHAHWHRWRHWFDTTR